MPILFRGCDLNDAFLTDADMMNRFVGQELWVSGRTLGGALGNNLTTPTFISSPVQTVAGGTNWASISTPGTQAACAGAAIKTDGTLWNWGTNGVFQLGDGTLVARSSPVQTVGSATSWRCLAVGGLGHSIATKTDGTLWGWGENLGGNLGTNDTTRHSSPVQTISATTNWKTPFAGGGHAAATKTDGTLWLWGCNIAGQLGNSDAINRSSPVQTVSITSDWKTVSLAYRSSFAIKTNGSLWSWGCGRYGMLGSNITVNLSSPAQLTSGSTNWKNTNSGRRNTSAIKTDGTLWLWGCAGFGLLGNLNSSCMSSPVQTVSSTTNWRAGSTGYNASGGIKTDGTLWVWGAIGNRHSSQTGISFASSPVQSIAGGTNWRSICVGYIVMGLRLTGE